MEQRDCAVDSSALPTLCTMQVAPPDRLQAGASHLLTLTNTPLGVRFGTWPGDRRPAAQPRFADERAATRLTVCHKEHTVPSLTIDRLNQLLEAERKLTQLSEDRVIQPFAEHMAYSLGTLAANIPMASWPREFHLAFADAARVHPVGAAAYKTRKGDS